MCGRVATGIVGGGGRGVLGVYWQRLLPGYAAREVKGSPCQCVQTIKTITQQPFILSQPELTGGAHGLILL